MKKATKKITKQHYATMSPLLKKRLRDRQNYKLRVERQKRVEGEILEACEYVQARGFRILQGTFVKWVSPNSKSEPECGVCALSAVVVRRGGASANPKPQTLRNRFEELEAAHNHNIIFSAAKILGISEDEASSVLTGFDHPHGYSKKRTYKGVGARVLSKLQEQSKIGLENREEEE